MANSTKKNIDTASDNSRTKRNIRIDDELYEDINNIATKENTTTVDIFDRALRMYRDAFYMEHKSMVIPDEILKAVRAELAFNNTQNNNKINKLMSELAISLHIVTTVVAQGLDFNAGQLEELRIQAVEHIQDSQRIFSLNDFV